MMSKNINDEIDESVTATALWDSGVAYSEIHGILYIRGDCVPVGDYLAHWDGTGWTLTLPEGVVKLEVE